MSSVPCMLLDRWGAVTVLLLVYAVIIRSVSFSRSCSKWRTETEEVGWLGLERGGMDYVWTYLSSLQHGW